jgi:predicted enzyme related to lactoylglutathione lyase
MTDVREAESATSTNDNQPNPPGAFIWYELMTTDADGASQFYSAVVPGWRFGERMPGDVNYRGIERGDGGNAGGVLQLDESMRTHGARPIWLGYVNVANVDDAVASIEQAGGKSLMPAFDVPNVGRIAMVADPQGAPFYIMKPIPPAGQEKKASDVFSPDQQQRVSWNELSTSDPAAARKFYVDQFGWGTDDFMDMGAMGEYRFIDQAGARIGALCGVMPGQEPKWRYYIRVPSISAAKDIAEQKGGTIHMGPHQVPTGDYIIIGSDPQGAEFALVGGQ